MGSSTVLTPWQICTQRGLGATISSTNNTRRIVCCETPESSATWRRDAFFSSTRCNTVGHWEAGRPAAGYFGPGLRSCIRGECFSALFHLQPEGLGACETGFPTAQGREKKLVTEEPKPVGSGTIIYPFSSFT